MFSHAYTLQRPNCFGKCTSLDGDGERFLHVPWVGSSHLLPIIIQT